MLDIQSSPGSRMTGLWKRNDWLIERSRGAGVRRRPSALAVRLHGPDGPCNSGKSTALTTEIGAPRTCDPADAIYSAAIESRFFGSPVATWLKPCRPDVFSVLDDLPSRRIQGVQNALSTALGQIRRRASLGWRPRSWCSQ